MSMSLTALKEVNKRCLKALEANGADTVEMLCEMTIQELGKMKGIGVTGQCEIKRALNDIGLKLREG